MNATTAIDPRHAAESAFDGTPLRHPDRRVLRYRPLRAVHHFRELLKDKEDTSHVFRIYESLPPRSFMGRVRTLALSEKGEQLRHTEQALPEILDDHVALRKMPKGSVAHAYCDFMEGEGLSAAGLVAESHKLGRKRYDDLVQWYSDRSRDTHDLQHVLTGYGRDALGEQCVLLFNQGQAPSLANLLIGYAGALHIRKIVSESEAPVLKAVRQAHRIGKGADKLMHQSIRDLLATNLQQARRMLGIPEPTLYRKCHEVWRAEGIDPYNLIAPGEGAAAEPA
ncbi:Coq4 family protein [Alteriqipengyuania sp. WL0013]|uniref:Coq4 family protein n=1 Tax=Alteriqipengyuania sp. WL0013 TaxID=3110773 RepID=UPI002C4167A9|nr:Coq4 family protein [Alteriqipengyuania sp. WL0013]MEB3415056.1 Coq4 family protein [Alteriqipengyuania sp. WL0013]